MPNTKPKTKGRTPVTASEPPAPAPVVDDVPVDDGIVTRSVRIPKTLFDRATHLGKKVIPGGKSLNKMLIEGLAREVAQAEKDYVK